MPDQVVWENTVDNNTWLCQVTREKPYSGLLIVTEVATGEIIHSEPVTIAYDAPFGPDVCDVKEWQNICIQVIDHPEKRKQE